MVKNNILEVLYILFLSLDYCGQCGGDNSTCKLITGSFNSSQNGYTSIDTIPAGASNLDVRQRGYLNSNKDNNYLGLLNFNFWTHGIVMILIAYTSILVIHKFLLSYSLTF